MKKNKVYIIAEAGVNHNGDFEIAKQLIEKSAEIGADAIKFQMFRPDCLVHPKAEQAEYQKAQGKNKTQYELLQGLTLPEGDYVKLKEIADQHHIQFLTTPFDLESLSFLIKLNLPYIKIGSGDLTHGPLLLEAAQKNQRIILSTGMANLEEIRQALYVLAFGYTNPKKTPKSFKEISDYCLSTDWKLILQDKVIVLHCTSEYPAPLDDINLNVLSTLESEFSLNVGYSDHSTSLLVPCLAVAKGAKVIEKHITLSNEMEGPDHKASLNIESFKEQLRQIRLTKKILGSQLKEITLSESKNKSIVRRGVYVARDLVKGHVVCGSDLLYLRPETNRSPIHSWELVGKSVENNYKELMPI